MRRTIARSRSETQPAPIAKLRFTNLKLDLEVSCQFFFLLGANKKYLHAPLNNAMHEILIGFRFMRWSQFI